jgi:hypothetical protein
MLMMMMLMKWILFLAVLYHYFLGATVLAAHRILSSPLLQTWAFASLRVDVKFPDRKVGYGKLI